MSAAKAERQSRGAVVRPAAFAREDALAEGLRQGDPDARRTVFDLFAPHARSVLARLLGPSIDLADPLHDTFVEVFRSAPNLRQTTSLKAWITAVAVHMARRTIRSRRRRRWLSFFAPADIPDLPGPAPTEDAARAVAATYRVLDRLPDDARVVFVLRYIEGLELRELAETCGISLATAKRRIAVATNAFLEVAKTQPELLPWIQEGRWTSK
jgi:RNA polymerase sigma-70 factor (ECF subfamily)